MALVSTGESEGNRAVHGNFMLPQLARIHAPAGLTGAGSLRATPDGLAVDAVYQAQGLVSAAGWLGFFGGLLLQIAMWRLLSSVISSALPWMIFPLVGPIAAIAYARRLARPKPIALTIPWSKIKGAVLGPQIFSFRSKVKPRGAIHFGSTASGDLHELATALRGYGVTVRETTAEIDLF